MVETHLIGDKSIFGIEVSIACEVPDFLGFLRIWINGTYLGYFEEECYLKVIAGVLTDVSKSYERLNFSHFQGLSYSAIYDAVKEDSDECECYHLILGDTFDDFSMTVFVTDSQYVFVWKLNDDPFFKYEKYPTEVLHGRVQKESFEQVVKSFSKLLNM